MTKRKQGKTDSLGSVLNQSEKIKDQVEQAASDLTSVNEALKQGNQADLSIETINDAIDQNEDVKDKVAQAADDLGEVNTELAREVAERENLEAELSETKTRLAKVREDLSESQSKEEESRESALHDALTGLPNRLLFEEVLDQGLTQAKQHRWVLAILFIDIDDFKRVNDKYGHDLGDKVLIRLAKRLQASVREEDMVSRWGGDEFVCLLLEIRQKADITRHAQEIVRRISRPMTFQKTVVSITASIGIAIYPTDGETAGILFKNADTAMYQAKGTKNRVMLFSENAAAR